jgi:hypothetical protein
MQPPVELPLPYPSHLFWHCPSRWPPFASPPPMCYPYGWPLSLCPLYAWRNVGST